jgi:hypothetical protein
LFCDAVILGKKILKQKYYTQLTKKSLWDLKRLNSLDILLKDTEIKAKSYVSSK